MKNLTIALSIVALAQLAQAQTAPPPPGSNTGPTSGSSSSSGVVPPPASGDLPTPPSLPTSVDPATSVQNQAGVGTSVNHTQMLLGIAAVAGGTLVAAKYCPSAAYSAVLCIAGIAAAAGGALIANGATKTENQSTAAGNTVTSGAPTTPPTALPFPNPIPIGGSSTTNPVGSINPNTGVVTLPNGSQVPASQLASGNFSGTGLTPSQQSAAQDSLKGLMANAAQQAALKSGDGNANQAAVAGGADASPGGASNSLNAVTDSPSGLPGRKDAVNPARRVAGLPGAGLNVGGNDRIGTASGNLFQMVSDRMLVIGNAKGFVDPIP